MLINFWQNALEIDPNWQYAHIYIGHYHILKGNYEVGIRAIETGARIMGQNPQAPQNLGWAYATAGRTQEARNLLNDMHELVQKEYVPAIVFACIYAGLGENHIAFDWFEKAVNDRDSMMHIILWDPALDPLRSHLRYHALLRKMNLEA
jgi:tetratricopeptide (TPR) repeat protein